MLNSSPALSCLASHKWDAYKSSQNSHISLARIKSIFFHVFILYIEQTKVNKCVFEKSGINGLKRHSKAKRTARARAYSRPLRGIKVGFQRGSMVSSGPMSRPTRT